MDSSVTATNFEPRNLITSLCTLFYEKGWVSGTGGGMSVARDGHVYIAPSGVQKERIREEDIFVMDLATEAIVSTPADSKLRISACTPLFLHAYKLRNAGAVIHSHSMNAVLATMMYDSEFRITNVEMIKGIAGHGYYDTLVVPIIENTAHEHELADSLERAMQLYPHSFAVLVRRHGLYVWGKDWVEAKTHVEVYDYLFELAVSMKRAGLDPEQPEPRLNDEDVRTGASVSGRVLGKRVREQEEE